MFFTAGLLALLAIANAGGDHIKGGSHLIQETFSQEEIAPSPYSFNIQTGASYGARVSREETGDAEGRIKGSYIVSGLRGTSRIVDYQADEAGFHANIKTSEPNIKTHSPANAHVEVISKTGNEGIFHDGVKGQGGKIHLSSGPHHVAELPFGLNPIIHSDPLHSPAAVGSVNTTDIPAEGLIAPFLDQDLQLRDPAAFPVINSGIKSLTPSTATVKTVGPKLQNKGATQPASQGPSFGRPRERIPPPTASNVGRQPIIRNTQDAQRQRPSDFKVAEPNLRPQDLSAGNIQFTLGNVGTERTRQQDSSSAKRVSSTSKAMFDSRNVITLSEQELGSLRPGQIVTLKDGVIEGASIDGSRFGQRPSLPNVSSGRQGLNVRNQPFSQNTVPKPATLGLNPERRNQVFGQRQSTATRVANLSPAARISTNIQRSSVSGIHSSLSQNTNKNADKISHSVGSSAGGPVTSAYRPESQLNPASINSPFTLDITPDMVNPDGTIILSGIHEDQLAGLVSGAEGIPQDIFQKNQVLSRTNTQQGTIQNIQRNVELQQKQQFSPQSAGFSRQDGVIVLNQELSPDQLSAITVVGAEGFGHQPIPFVPNLDQTLKMNREKTKLDASRAKDILRKDSQRLKSAGDSRLISGGNVQFTLGDPNSASKSQIRKSAVFDASVTRNIQNVRSRAQQQGNIRTDTLKVSREKLNVRKQPSTLGDAALKEKGENYFIMGDISQVRRPNQNVRIGSNIPLRPYLHSDLIKASKEKSNVRKQGSALGDSSLKDKGENYFIMGDISQSRTPVHSRIEVPSPPVLQIAPQIIPGSVGGQFPTVQYVDGNIQSLGPELISGVVIDGIHHQNFDNHIKYEGGHVVAPSLPVVPFAGIQSVHKPNQNIPASIKPVAARGPQQGAGQIGGQTTSGVRQTLYATGQGQRKPSVRAPIISSGISQSVLPQTKPDVGPRISGSIEGSNFGQRAPIGGQSGTTILSSGIARRTEGGISSSVGIVGARGAGSPRISGVANPSVSRVSGGIGLRTQSAPVSPGLDKATGSGIVGVTRGISGTEQRIPGTIGAIDFRQRTQDTTISRTFGSSATSGLRSSAAAGSTGIRPSVGIRSSGIRTSSISGVSGSGIPSGPRASGFQATRVGVRPGLRTSNIAQTTGSRISGTDLRSSGLAGTISGGRTSSSITKPGAINERTGGGNVIHFTMGAPNTAISQSRGAVDRSNITPLHSQGVTGEIIPGAVGTRSPGGTVFQSPPLILNNRGVEGALRFGISGISRESTQGGQINPGIASTTTTSGRDIRKYPTVNVRTPTIVSDQRKRGELASRIPSSVNPIVNPSVFAVSPGTGPVLTDARIEEGLRRVSSGSRLAPGFGQRSSGFRKDQVLQVVTQEHDRSGIVQEKVSDPASVLNAVKGDIRKEITQVREPNIQFVPVEASAISQKPGIFNIPLRKASQSTHDSVVSGQSQLILEDIADHSPVANPAVVNVLQVKEPISLGVDDPTAQGQIIQATEVLQKPVRPTEDANRRATQQRDSNVANISGYKPRTSFLRGPSPIGGKNPDVVVVQEQQKLEQILI